MPNTTSSMFNFRTDIPQTKMSIPEAKSQASPRYKTRAEEGSALVKAIHSHIAKSGGVLDAKAEAPAARKTRAEEGIRLVKKLHEHLKKHHGFPDAKLESDPAFEVEGDANPSEKIQPHFEPRK
jgi:predicted small metal-binding protein